MTVESWSSRSTDFNKASKPRDIQGATFFLWKHFLLKSFRSERKKEEIFEPIVLAAKNKTKQNNDDVHGWTNHRKISDQSFVKLTTSHRVVESPTSDLPNSITNYCCCCCCYAESEKYCVWIFGSFLSQSQYTKAKLVSISISLLLWQAKVRESYFECLDFHLGLLSQTVVTLLPSYTGWTKNALEEIIYCDSVQRRRHKLKLKNVGHLRRQRKEEIRKIKWRLQLRHCDHIIPMP